MGLQSAAKNSLFSPSDIILHNSLKILKMALPTSQNPPEPQPIHINISHTIHSSFFCPTRGTGRSNYTPPYHFCGQLCLFCCFQLPG